MTDRAIVRPEGPRRGFEITRDGIAKVNFDLPRDATSYKIRIEGHTASGRLGVLERTLETRKSPAAEVK